MNVKKNLEDVLSKIQKAKSNSQNITLVAVSKTVDSETIKLMYKAGQMDFGENRVQVLKPKTQELENLNINWHFIGRLQTNKINQLIALSPTLWHSCDSLERAKEYDKRLCVQQKIQDTLLQINSANEDEKQGVSVQKAVETYLTIKETCPNLNLKGVMSIGAFTDDIKVIQQSFEATYKIYEQLQKQGATICSMGMSKDYELAIQCGSNMVRVGSSLFQ